MESPQHTAPTSALTLTHYNAWQLIRAYWQSEDRFFAYGFAALILALTVSLVGVDVVFSYWYNNFYNALQAYDKTGVLRLLGVFCVIAATTIVLAVYRYYITQYFSLRWRKWLTNQFVGRWLSNRSYYLLENFDENTDNPDQRIQEDVTAIIGSTIDLVVGLLGSVITLFSFIFVLWSLSGVLVIPFGRFGTVAIPGYLVWVSLVYASVGTMLTIKIGRPLVALNFEQQRREATFRYAAVEVRNHAEHIAMYQGEHHQQTILNGLFDRVLGNFYLIILRQKLLLWFTAGYNQVAVILPLIVALPNYFGKVFKLGGLMQSLNAFGKVQDSFSFIVNAYTQIAQWQAVAQRLTSFINHMNEADAKAAMENKMVCKTHAAPTILVRDVALFTPRGEVLLQGVNADFVHGHRYLVQGDSGIGKSTFVRALAGIWPFGSGELTFPDNQTVMYLPQQPYMPIGTLEEAVLFPDHDKPELRSRVVTVMEQCNLGHLVKRLDEVMPWAEQLSPGEQQRIAFARVLLHRPDWVFLDESTSSMDVTNEAMMYDLLTTHLPGCSIISVGHRPTLAAFHDKVINMVAYRPLAVV